MTDESLIAVLLSRLNALSDSVSQLAQAVLQVDMRQKACSEKCPALVAKVDALIMAERTRENIAAGRQAQRSEDVAKLNLIPTFFGEYWPLIVGLLLSAIGVGGFVWSRLPL